MPRIRKGVRRLGRHRARRGPGQRHAGAGRGAQGPGHRPGRRGGGDAAHLPGQRVLRGECRRHAGVCRRRPGQRQPDGRHHRRGAHPAHACRDRGAPGRLAGRHGPDHGAGRAARPEGDRGLRPGARRALPWPQRRQHRPRGRLELLPGQDHDHRRRRRHGHDQRRSAVARHVGLQGPRQELGRGVRAPAPTRLSLAARGLWHQLAHAGAAGRHRPHPARPHGRLDGAAHGPRGGAAGGAAALCRRRRGGAGAGAVVIARRRSRCGNPERRFLDRCHWIATLRSR